MNETTFRAIREATMKAGQTSRRRRGGPGRLSAEEAAGLVDRLLDAASHLFATNGFGDTSMEAIAREARASTKTLYSRYANKNELLRAVTDRMADRILSARSEIATDPGGVEPRAFLIQFARQLATMFNSAEMIGMVRVAISEAHRMPEVGDFFVEAFTRNVTALRQVLEQWHDAGRLPDLPRSSQEAARVFIEMAAGIPRIRALIGRPLTRKEVDEHVATAVDLFLRGCGYRVR
jgi:TetR/AcrR family transcriptional regulator, mexJK operon transcriptional repressor